MDDYSCVMCGQTQLETMNHLFFHVYLIMLAIFVSFLDSSYKLPEGYLKQSQQS
jgi:hypothetical protein